MDNVAPTYEPLLHFWLGEPGADPLANAGRWFSVDPTFDAELRSRFSALLERGERDELEPWRTTPRGSLAYVILHDQIPRNIFRGTRKAFSHDERALEATLVAIARGFEADLGIVERWFLYMPLMHAEDITYQQRCVDAFARLADECEIPLRGALQNSLDYAIRHRDVVARFGRFPHRNAALGRTSTADEIEFLQEPGSSF
ncbi:DUF924 family protein [Chondromyces crocatus]|uniref:Transmembrane protein n=1 Tax=Chondromyces crocatus TaxID=52 RepID=A0A0K1EIK0_CHOCO|nr:DUF924 family protein [Chondromyces crocatus]AKT40512.1 uncharacterized protein CMC5_046670 [Chondromyces crocatus]